ncbi:MAG: hypothetical protein AAGB34_11730, partial [Planctomycetota bacterium]
DTLISITGTLVLHDVDSEGMVTETPFDVILEGEGFPSGDGFPLDGGFSFPFTSGVITLNVALVELDIVVVYDNSAPVTGACCDGTACLDDVLSSNCAGETDTFLANATCFNVSCGEGNDIGACCADIAGPTCIESTTRTECEAIGGFGFSGSTGQSGVGLVRVGQDCSDNNAMAGADACEEPVVEPCLGDANADLAVNVDDFIAVLLNFGSDGSNGGDANADNMVDVQDFIEVLLNFGSDCP